MTVGTSIFLIVIGAILRYAITWKLPAIDVAAVGVILMVAGTVSLAVSVVWAFRPNRLKAETDGSPLKTFGNVPPAPRWHTGDTTTYAMPFDARHTGAFASPVVAPHIAAPWYDSDTDPYVQPYAQPQTPIADTADDPAYELGAPHHQDEQPAPRWRDPED